MLDYARRRLRGPNAEDAIQEAFCAAIQKAEIVNAAPNPIGWLFQALKFEILNEIQRSEKNILLGKKLIQRKNVADMCLDNLLIWEVCRFGRQGGIEAEDMDIFLLHYLAGYQYAELAEGKNRTEAAVKIRMYRTRKALAGIIKKCCKAA